MNRLIKVTCFSLVLTLLLSGYTLVLAQDSAQTEARAEPEAQTDALPNFAPGQQYAPVPEYARGPEIPEKGYLLDDLGDGLYGVRNGNSNSMFFVTNAGVVVVDASFPRAGGNFVVQAIAEVTDLPVTHFVYSHPHADHVAGASMFQRSDGSGPIYVGHERTAERLRRMNDPLRPVPTAIFSGERYELNVGDSQLILGYHGDIHSAGGTFIFAPKQKVLMLVDVLTPRWAPYYKLGHTPDVPRFMEITKQILEYDFETFIGGHAGWYGTRTDIEDIGRYMADLDTACRQAFNEVPNLPEGDPLNAWQQSQIYYEGTARRCAELMPKSWLTKLGGADVFLLDNAHSLIYSLATDYPRVLPSSN